MGVATVNSKSVLAAGCVIWMHGLGADATDMENLAAAQPIADLALKHNCLDAPIRAVTLNAGMRMRAWYDVVGLTLTAKEDREGILQSYNRIMGVIKDQVSAGYAPQTIVLAGFSQGGAMALYTALHCHLPLAGVMALSAYLPLALECRPTIPRQTPIFLGSGLHDTIVLPAWTKQSKDWLMAHGFSEITWRQYPMAHAICLAEIQDIAGWLATCLKKEV